MNTQTKTAPAGKRLAANSVIVLSFIVALEFVIMISPFAFVFYAALNPFLLALNQSTFTRWLTAFFLPHMVVPPDAFLKTVRVLGSVAFLGGMIVFLVCALQVYAGKLFRPGVAQLGLYALVRHPQYVALAIAAWGLARLAKLGSRRSRRSEVHPTRARRVAKKREVQFGRPGSSTQLDEGKYLRDRAKTFDIYIATI